MDQQVDSAPVVDQPEQQKVDKRVLLQVLLAALILVLVLVVVVMVFKTKEYASDSASNAEVLKTCMDSNKDKLGVERAAAVLKCAADVKAARARVKSERYTAAVANVHTGARGTTTNYVDAPALNARERMGIRSYLAEHAGGPPGRANNPFMEVLANPVGKTLSDIGRNVGRLLGRDNLTMNMSKTDRSLLGQSGIQ